MLTKLGASFCLLAFAVACVIVIRGWTTNVEEVIGPDASAFKKGTEAYAKTPKAKVDEAAAAGNIATLMRDAQFSAAAQMSQKVTAEQMTKILRDSEPGIPVGKPINSGGIQVDVAEGGRIVVLCAHPAYYYCGATDLSNRAISEAEAKSLSEARKQAVKRVILAGKSKGASASGASAPHEGAEGLGSQIADKAKELQ